MRPQSQVALSFVELSAEMTEYKPGIHGHLTRLRKISWEKQTGKLLATKHAHIDCLIMYPENGGVICMLKWCAY